MEYCVLGKDNITGKSAEQVITLMLHEYSRQLYGFTRAEFDSIVEYDVLIIMASYYTKINAQQKKVIISALQEEFSLCDLESVLENLAMYIDDKLYMPLSCMQTAETKKRNLLYTRQRKDKSEKITKLTEENGIIKKKIFDESEKQTEIQQRIQMKYCLM